MTNYKRTSEDGFTTTVTHPSDAARLTIADAHGSKAFNVYSGEGLQAVANAISTGQSLDRTTDDGYRTQVSVRSGDVVLRITEADGTTAFDVYNQTERQAIAAALRD